MQRTSFSRAALLAILMTTAAAPALAQSKGDLLIGLGAHIVDPSNDSGSPTAAGVIDVDSNIRPTITAEYFIADNIGIELLAAWPFQHDINLAGAGEIGSVRQLPPTLSLQYHFTNASPITPFIGVGINYTFFFDGSSEGAIAGTELDLDDSFGVAFHAGLDYQITDRGSLRADVRYIDIDTDVSVNGAEIGNVALDPWVFGVAYVHKF